MLLREIFVPPPAWLRRGGGMPRCAEFYTQKPARRKASPGGEAGSPQGLTDEVEAIVHHHESVQNCYPRPHPSRFRRDTFSPGRRLWSVQTGNPYRPSSVCPYGQPLSRGMTATGSHIHFYSLRGAQPPGEGSPQKGRQPSTKSNRTPPPSPSVTPPPTRREAAPRRGYLYSPPGRYKLPGSFSQRCHLG